jgi:hypothetical protein
MKKANGQSGYIALMATIIISLILLVMTVEEGSIGWHARFNILGTEAKEQATALAEGCAEQAMAKLLTDPTYNGNSTTTFPYGTCYTFPIELNTPNNGMLTIKTQAVIRNSYTNLKISAHMNNIIYGNTGTISPTQSSLDTGGDGNGFEINPYNAFTDGISGIAGSAQNIDGAGDRHRFSGYNFSIPAGSTITGIQVRLDWWLNSVNGTNNIETELSWDGGANWTSIKTASNESTSISNSIILGAPGDTWGRTWTTSELSEANFVVRIKTNSSVSSRDFFLDWIPVTVNYLNNVNNVSSGNFFITPIESWYESANP